LPMLDVGDLILEVFHFTEVRLVQL
jgi:hypothetical protein